MVGKTHNIQEAIDNLKLRVDMFLPKKTSKLVISTRRRSSLPVVFMTLNESYK